MADDGPQAAGHVLDRAVEAHHTPRQMKVSVEQQAKVVTNGGAVRHPQGKLSVPSVRRLTIANIHPELFSLGTLTMSFYCMIVVVVVVGVAVDD